jgi:oligoribonuclease (3'-5' exoribonuclease)
MQSLSKEELIEAAFTMTGGNLKDLSVEQIERLMTVTQYVTDICLNELEERGEMVSHKGAPVVPYISEYMVETILTRR